MSSLAQQPALKALADDEVVARVRAGEIELYELIMRRYNQRLYRAARAILKDEAEAEEVVQEAYVRGYLRLDQFHGDARFSTWLTKIVVHEALARVRRRRRFEELVEEQEIMEPSPQAASNPEAQALAHETRALLEASIDALPEIYRSVFVLREVEELSTAETAECLGLTEETVKIRLYRARALLRRTLFEQAGATRTEAFSFLAERCDRMVRTVLERITPRRP